MSMLFQENHMIEDIDYLVSAVEYDPSDDKIKKVLTHEKKGEVGVGYPFEETRDHLLKKINEGKTYYTLVKEEESSFEYNLGEEIQKVEVDSDTFLRTDGENKKKDKLADLQPLGQMGY